MSIKNLSSSFLVLTLIFTGISISQDSGLEEVTVTAQRQEQSLQDVPLAVSALSEDDLFEQQIEGAGDLQLTVPSLRFETGNFSGGGGFDIRGITNLQFQLPQMPVWQLTSTILPLEQQLYKMVISLTCKELR